MQQFTADCELCAIGLPDSHITIKILNTLWVILIAFPAFLLLLLLLLLVLVLVLLLVLILIRLEVLLFWLFGCLACGAGSVDLIALQFIYPRTQDLLPRTQDMGCCHPGDT